MSGFSHTKSASSLLGTIKTGKPFREAVQRGWNGRTFGTNTDAGCLNKEIKLQCAEIDEGNVKKVAWWTYRRWS